MKLSRLKENIKGAANVVSVLGQALVAVIAESRSTTKTLMSSSEVRDHTPVSPAQLSVCEAIEETPDSQNEIGLYHFPFRSPTEESQEDAFGDQAS